jgi:uncharacterized protein YkwD
MLLRLYLLLLLSLSKSVATNKSLSLHPEGNETPGRDQILKWYKTEYLSSGTKSYKWDGNVDECKEGTIPADIQAKVLKRINYFRKMAGVDPVIFKDSLSRQAQKAALMMKANNALSHMPPKNWKCYSAEGAFAASYSDLSYGDNNAESVTGFIEDAGGGNNEAGHRRWILNSQAKVFGHGATDVSDALWVVPVEWREPTPFDKFIAWPCQGYIPAPLVFDRWSFAYPKADFSDAKVSMTGPDDEEVELKIEEMTPNNNIVGDRAIVWVPEGINKSSDKDITYTVNITHVKIGDDFSDFTYKVTLIQVEGK